MHLRNKRPVLGVVFLFLFSAFAFQARAQNSQDQPRIQPPALPSDVDPGDPALPVWMRPAAPAANRNPSPAGGATTPGTPPGNNAANNVPPDNENATPGKTGEVTADKGSFRYRKEVEEVTLSATVVDQ